MRDWKVWTSCEERSWFRKACSDSATVTGISAVAKISVRFEMNEMASEHSWRNCWILRDLFKFSRRWRMASFNFFHWSASSFKAQSKLMLWSGVGTKKILVGTWNPLFWVRPGTWNPRPGTHFDPICLKPGTRIFKWVPGFRTRRLLDMI